MKTVKTFQAALENNQTLVAVAVMGICTITLCCGDSYFCEEECDSNITITQPDNGSAVCADSVTEQALTYCDDEYDLVQMYNSKAPSATLYYDQIQEGHLFWNTNDAPLAAGDNKLVATGAGCGVISSVVDVPSNGGSGYGWWFYMTDENATPCGFDYNVVAICFPDGPYKAYETSPDGYYEWYVPCLQGYVRIRPDSLPLDVTSTAGKLIIPDAIQETCPNIDYTTCTYSYKKTWNIYNSITHFFQQAPEEEISFIKQNPGSPMLTITDSQISGYTYTNN